MSMTPDETGAGPAAFLPVPAPQEPDPAELLKRRVYMGFAAIVAVGLAVAGLYIGGRLFARPKPKHGPLVVATVAHPAPQPVAAKSNPIQATVQAPAKPAAEPVAAPPPAPATPAQGVSALITPKAGEKYLQLAALGTGYTERYVKKLEAQGIHVSVAPGPSETIYRVVVGPFADRSELVRQRDALEAAGIQSMPRVY